MSPSFSPQLYEESQLKWTCGESYTERFRWLQGQPNSRRIHRQQFQRQKKWQVKKKRVCPVLCSHVGRKLRFVHLKTHWSPRQACSNGSPGGWMLNNSCLFTPICFAANRGIQCSMQVRTRGSVADMYDTQLKFFELHTEGHWVFFSLRVVSETSVS